MVKSDPNAPKRPLSGYFKFLGDVRADLQKENPEMSHKERTKLAGVKWGQLSQEEQTKYKDGYKEAMAEWKKKFEVYKQTDSYKEFKAAKVAKEKKERKKKYKKDANAPKKPAQAYFIFSSEKRPELIASLPEADKKSITKHAKMLGEMWRNCSAEEKESYREKAKKLKEVYEEAFAAYKETDEYANYQKDKAAFDKAQKDKRDKAAKKSKMGKGKKGKGKKKRRKAKKSDH